MLKKKKKIIIWPISDRANAAGGLCEPLGNGKIQKLTLAKMANTMTGKQKKNKNDLYYTKPLSLAILSLSCIKNRRTGFQS